MQMISLSVFYLHSNKLGLLKALGRIKVEVCFECTQREGGGDRSVKREKMGTPHSVPVHITVHYFI